MRQIEVSRTIVFTAPCHARAFFEALVADNLDIGRSEQVELIFCRPSTARSQPVDNPFVREPPSRLNRVRNLRPAHADALPGHRRRDVFVEVDHHTFLNPPRPVRHPHGAPQLGVFADLHNRRHVRAGVVV